jgi:starch synthase
MRLLFVASEVEPYSKTGGLADVLGALPAALAGMGHDVMVVSPRYGSIDAHRFKLRSSGKTISAKFPYGEPMAELFLAPHRDAHPHLRHVFLDQPAFFGRKGIYGEGGDYPDNARRFAFLSKGALEAARALGFRPDVVHGHDWQTGLLPLHLDQERWDSAFFGRTRSVFTIHNLGYQGVFGKEIMGDLGIPWEYFTMDRLELHDRVSFLKAGLELSDQVTTVSRRYAEEIQTPEHGWGLDGALRSRHHRLTGILNGVDYKEWDPSTDESLPERYSPADLSGKTRCHHSLAETFGLRIGPETLVVGIVTRLAYQKGIDLVLEASQQLMELDCALVVLGDGDPAQEQGLRYLAMHYPGRCANYIGFDRKLSRWVIAGSDALLMPSRYEPCGLSQLYALRYGTVPIVRATGGLDDTVVDATQPDGTGFKFEPFARDSLVNAVRRAVDAFRNRHAWRELMLRGMRSDFSWQASAHHYEALYKELVAGG